MHHCHGCRLRCRILKKTATRHAHSVGYCKVDSYTLRVQETSLEFWDCVRFPNQPIRTFFLWLPLYAWKRTKLEIWPQRPMYFAATIAIHHSAVRGVALSMGVVLFMGVVLSMVGGTFHGWWLWSLLGWRPAGRVASMGLSAKPKVLLLAKPLELQ